MHVESPTVSTVTSMSRSVSASIAALRDENSLMRSSATPTISHAEFRSRPRSRCSQPTPSVRVRRSAQHGVVML